MRSINRARNAAGSRGRSSAIGAAALGAGSLPLVSAGAVAAIAGYTLGLPTTNALVRRLQDDVALRDVCGFTDDSQPVDVNRFVSRLSHHADVVETTSP